MSTPFQAVPPQIINKIREEYINGEAIKRLCNRYGLSNATICRYTSDLRVKENGRWVRLTPDDAVKPPVAPEPAIDIDFSGLMEQFRTKEFTKVIFDIERNKVAFQRVETTMVDLDTDA